MVGLIGLVMLLLSCDVAGGLFSQSELADMYEVWIEIDGMPLGDGDLVRIDSSLIPVIESPGSVSDPGRLSLVLVDMDGVEAARLTYLTGAGSALDVEDVSLRSVRSLRGALPSFAFPADMAEGYYFLETRLYDSLGRVLSNDSTLVLVYNGMIPAPRIEVFPSSPAQGQPVFLRLVSDLPGEVDPWLRWYIGTGIRKEGYASDFADRLVWQVPEADGFFSVRAEVFPFKPPVEVLNRSVALLKPRLPAFRADLILAVGPAQTTSYNSGIDQAFSVDFKSDTDAQHVESADGSSSPLLMIGSPYVESHDSGYGHAVPTGSGYLVPGTILPQAGTPFTLCLAFDPMDKLGASGALVTLLEADGTSSFLRLGISGGLPYLEAGNHIVQAFVDLPAGLSHLVLEVVPSKTDMAETIVSLFLNNELVGNGAVSSSSFARAGPYTTLIGGSEGLAVVYDAFAVIHGKYQAFLAAKSREFGGSLIAASGFEGGALGRGISVQGSVEAEDGFIALNPDTALEIPVPVDGFIMDMEGYGAPPGLLLVMDDGSLLTLNEGKSIPGLLPALTSSEVKETLSGEEAATDSGPSTSAVLGGEQPATPQSISISIEAVAGGLRIRDAAGRNERIPTVLSVVSLRVQPALPVPLTIQTIMVRTFSPATSLERAARLPLLPLPEATN
jgi:hypothetical protein